MEVLARELGHDWPSQAWVAHGELPLALASAGSHTLAYTGVVELAARLTLLSGRPGYADLCRDIRRDRRNARAIHTALQLETAGLALRQGHEVALEPIADGATRPADVQFSADDDHLVVETRVLFEAQSDAAVRRTQEALSERLWLTAAQTGMAIGGRLSRMPADRDLDEVEAWLGELASVLDGDQVARRDWEHMTLSASRNPTAAGALTLWPVTSHPMVRLLSAIRAKAQTMERARARWLRITAHNGLWGFTPWGRSPLTIEKVESLRQPVSAAVGDADIDGVVVSSAAGLYAGTAEDAEIESEYAIAIRRPVAPLRARETIVIATRGAGCRQMSRWRDIYDGERDWLSWALERLSLPDLEEILRPQA